MCKLGKILNFAEVCFILWKMGKITDCEGEIK